MPSSATSCVHPVSSYKCQTYHVLPWLWTQVVFLAVVQPYFIIHFIYERKSRSIISFHVDMGNPEYRSPSLTWVSIGVPHALPLLDPSYFSVNIQKSLVSYIGDISRYVLTTVFPLCHYHHSRQVCSLPGKYQWSETVTMAPLSPWYIMLPGISNSTDWHSSDTFPVYLPIYLFTLSMKSLEFFFSPMLLNAWSLRFLRFHLDLFLVWIH